MKEEKERKSGKEERKETQRKGERVGEERRESGNRGQVIGDLRGKVSS